MMSQTRSQIQFLQIACILLLITSLVGLVTAYVLYRDLKNAEEDVVQARAQVEQLKGEMLRLRGDLETLKSLTGYHYGEVGQEHSLESDTVVGKAQSDIRRLVGELSQPTLRNALVELHSRWRETTQERNTLREKLEKSAGRRR